MNPIEARAALDSIDAAQRDLALKATYCPPWRHAAFAAVLTILVLGVGFGPAIQLPSVVIAMAGVAWLVTDDRRRYGVGRARFVAKQWGQQRRYQPHA